MRKFIVAAALAASALTVAAPAAAQWAPPQPQGHAYGYHGNYGQVRRLDARIDALQRQIYRLDRRNMISQPQARQLRYQAHQLGQHLRFAARDGLSPWESRDIQNRLYRLETRVHRIAQNYGRPGYGYGYPAGGGWIDRDRDGRDDRWERRHDDWHDRNERHEDWHDRNDRDDD